MSTLATCHHEAGHAVAAVIAGADLESIRVFDAEGDWHPSKCDGGHCTIGFGGTLPKPLQRWRTRRPPAAAVFVANSIFISMAGDLAQAKFARKSRRAVLASYRLYAESALYDGGSELRRTRSENNLYNRYDAVPDQLDAARALADLRLETSDASAVLGAAFKAVQQLVCSGQGWEAVSALVQDIYRAEGFLGAPEWRLCDRKGKLVYDERYELMKEAKAAELVGGIRRIVSNTPEPGSSPRAVFWCEELERLPVN